MRLIHAAILLALLPGAAAAEVYKCKGRNGESVYSQHPCDESTQPMALRVTRPASSADPDAPPATAGSGLDAEQHCVSTAGASIYGPSNDRVASYQQQVAALHQQLAGAPDNAAIRGQVASLQQAIARERASANAQLGAARKRCALEHGATPASAPAAAGES